ncbi:class I SAM-dependent methyltransferase [bacterium AH-315-J19]|nr:class I SAM-dependent methyltransferase [Robiginitomaculum sp.]MBN4058520.1 class I SAM-dependent methyltransferase [bacterium AH-315-J19]
MATSGIGQQYDKIAAWWNDYHMDSAYGVAQIMRALSFAPSQGNALDVGCGSGGRIIRRLKEQGYEVTGIDASEKMINLARKNHPDSLFIHEDIRHWETEDRFDFIVAWDCLFHLPLSMQKPVLSKFCNMLSDRGVMIHTFGDSLGKHTDSWQGQKFHYSSIGMTQNIELLHENGLSVLHLELDQFPEKHVYIISKKLYKTEPDRLPLVGAHLT